MTCCRSPGLDSHLGLPGLGARAWTPLNLWGPERTLISQQMLEVNTDGLSPSQQLPAIPVTIHIITICPHK